MGGGEMMKMKDAIAVLVQEVPHPSLGLPDELFYYLSQITPLVNVDLLIRNRTGHTLLSWRDDPYAGKGWHVPGGIVRVKETMESRIQKVAETEIGASVLFDPVPLAVNQIIHPERSIRSHFISLLYKCSLPDTFTPANRGLSPGDRGYLQWHVSCPHDLIRVHEIYRKYMNPISPLPR